MSEAENKQALVFTSISKLLIRLVTRQHCFQVAGKFSFAQSIYHGMGWKIFLSSPECLKYWEKFFFRFVHKRPTLKFTALSKKCSYFFMIILPTKKYTPIEVSITQNDNIFSQVYLFICYLFNILRMTRVKSEIEQVCEISVNLFAHLCKFNSNFNM